MSDENAPRVVLVGHCRPDQFMLKSAIESLVPGVVVEVAMDDASARGMREDAGVLLVNRVLDGDFVDRSGIDLIANLSGAGARAMLISNLPEAQEEAEARGGLPGFGKSELRSERTRERLLAAVGRAG